MKKSSLNNAIIEALLKIQKSPNGLSRIIDQYRFVLDLLSQIFVDQNSLFFDCTVCVIHILTAKKPKSSKNRVLNYFLEWFWNHF